METWRDLKPTKKQLEFIESIQEFVDVEFVGITREEARDYIAANIDEFLLSQQVSGGQDYDY